MSDRVSRVGAVGAIHFDSTASSPAPAADCPWCGSQLDTAGKCSARCERSEQRVDRMDQRARERKDR